MNYNNLNNLSKNQLIAIIQNLQNTLNDYKIKDLLFDILESTQLPIITFNNDLKITFRNSYIINYFYNQIELKNLEDIVTPEKLSFIKELLHNNVNLFILQLDFLNYIPSQPIFSIFFRIPINNEYILILNDNPSIDIIDDIYLYKYCLDAAPIGLIISTMNDKIIYMNNTIKSFLNLTDDIKYGDHLKNAINYEIIDVIQKSNNYFQAIIKTNQKIFEIINKIIKFEDGQNPLAKLAIIIDISDKYQLQEQLNQHISRLEDTTKLLEFRTRDLLAVNEKLENTQKDLEKAIATKDKFFSILAHDLRSPFTALLGYTNILKEEFNDLSKDEMKYFIDQAHDVAQNTYNLLLNLLNFSRIQTGRFEFNPQLHTFDTILNQVINLLQGNLNAKSITVIKEYDNSIQVYADDKMLTSVLQNIIGNAIKFSNPSSKIYIKAQIENNNFSLMIRDEGIGMTQENLNCLFKIEQIFSKEGTNKEQGTGLGLIICKEFIEIHKGKIWAESELNKGTTFFISLPFNN